MTDRADPKDLDCRIRLRAAIIIGPLSTFLVGTAAPCAHTRSAEIECVA